MASRRIAGAALMLACAANLATSETAHAATPRITPDCGGPIIVLGEVASVIDGRSFLLADGREVRLAAIESPPVSDAGRDDARSGAGLAAKAALEALILHRSVAGRQAAAADRYGRLDAYFFAA